MTVLAVTPNINTVHLIMDIIFFLNQILLVYISLFTGLAFLK